MATFVRNRVLNQVAWPDEKEEQRMGRRDTLCVLDGLLAQLEEANLRGGVVPGRVLIALRRRGVNARPGVSPAELIEATFSAQEAFMRQPEGSDRLVAFPDLRRHIA